MKFTRQATALFLLSIFLFNTMGYFVAFKVAQLDIKTEMMAEMKDDITTDDDTEITINEDDALSIEWLEDKKEMRYKNNRYDVVKTETHGKLITYHCIKDTREDALFTNLDKHIGSHVVSTQPQKNHSSNTLTNDVVKLFFQHSYTYRLITSEQNITFLPIKEDFISAAIGTNTPPPELG